MKKRLSLALAAGALVAAMVPAAASAAFEYECPAGFGEFLVGEGYVRSPQWGGKIIEDGTTVLVDVNGDGYVCQRGNDSESLDWEGPVPVDNSVAIRFVKDI